MPITYTSRKGLTYILCKGVTKTGKPRYYFAREPKDEVAIAIPDGYAIQESVNGIVSLAKDRPSLILSNEVETVRKGLQRHPRSRRYRLDAKANMLVIYEAIGPSAEETIRHLGLEDPENKLARRIEIERDRYTQFTPVMRFILTDATARQFRAERWCYRGSVDDWIDVFRADKIEALSAHLLPKLGTDAFFELFR